MNQKANFMKKYFGSQNECAHAWAHGHYSEGYSSNFFFVGNTIFSYGHHFPIATIAGHNVFFTLKGYSKSTGKHKSVVRNAISHKQIVFVDTVPVGNPDNDTFQKMNIDHWVNEIESLLQDVAQHPRRKSLFGKVTEELNDLNNFLTALNISPDRSLKTLLESPSLQHVVALRKSQHKNEMMAAKKRQEKLLREHLRELKQWRAGEINELSSANLNAVPANTAYLRLNEQQTRIETSKGIVVPVAIASRFWSYIQSVIPTGCKDCNYSILDFKVNEITSEYIHIGCHKITMPEAEAIARTLNW